VNTNRKTPRPADSDRGQARLWLFLFLMVACFVPEVYSAAEGPESHWQPRAGMSKQELLEHFSINKERTYRIQGRQAWMTFEDGQGDKIRLITFHLEDGRVTDWARDDRKEVVREYTGEFCSQALLNSPKFCAAIRDVLTRMPDEAFLFVTRRDFPVLFTEYYSEGNARLSNSGEVLALEDDPPTFTRGIWIVKINDGLQRIAGQEAIEGIMAHELAHRVLRHSPNEKDMIQAEKAANRLIKEWGFQKEFTAAARLSEFSKKPG
jgi:hypothetical protein